MPATSHFSLLAALFAAAALLLLASVWHSGRPVELAAAPAGALQCVSYAPSGAGHGATQTVTREHIRTDLVRLAARLRCVRTYTVDHGFDQVPSVARELGLEVLLGVWIGGDAAHNEREIATAIVTARRDRDVIRAIVVGNEVLLRHELTADQLATLIRRVRNATRLPVTYADVWGRWVQHRALARVVSFVTVHIIPYWDDDPVGIDQVIPYVDGLYAEMQRIFPGKTVLIGETGWPSTGRPRGANVPGRVNQARYIREFTSHAAVRGIPYNLIEAFDQPWKRTPEGTVGGYWGLFDVEGHEKFPMVGPVVEAPRWRAAMVVAAVAGVLGALAGLLGGGARVHAAVVLASAGVLAGGIGLRQWEYLHAGNATALDWLVTLLVVGAGWLAFAFAVRALLSRHPVPDTMPRVLGFLLMLSCAYVCLGLVFAGRHRDFPVWLFLPAVVAFTTSAWLDPRLRAHTLRRQRAVEETLLAGWLVTAGVLIPSMEGFQNAGSIGWGASAAALGLSILLPLALESRLNQRPAKHADA